MSWRGAPAPYQTGNRQSDECRGGGLPRQLIPMGRIEHVGAHGKTQITSQRLCGGRLGGRALRRSHLACRDSSYGKIPLAKIFK